MKTLHPLNVIALLLAANACAFLATDARGLAYWAALAAFLLSLKALWGNATWPQRLGVVAVSVCLSLAAQFASWGGPLMGLALTLAALASASRLLLFEEISYTGWIFLEPALMLPALALWALAAFTRGSWQSWVFPLPVVGLCLYLVLREHLTNYRMLGKSLAGGRLGVGQLAPDFSLPDPAGNPVSLASFRGRPVLLMFAHGDWCPACHIMLRSYERARRRFQEKGVTLLAVGQDGSQVNGLLARKLGLEYQLLADPSQEVARAYGVRMDDPLMGALRDRPSMFVPASFLIAADGTVRYCSRPERVGEFLNPGAILPALESL